MTEARSLKGMARGIYLVGNPLNLSELYLLVVKNKKTEEMVVHYARRYNRDLEIPIKEALKRYLHIWSRKDENFTEFQRFCKSRRTYQIIKQWVFAERQKRADVDDTKRDRYEIPGGEFVDEPQTCFEIRGEACCAREFGEETDGLFVVNPKTKESLFHPIESHVHCYYLDDYDLPPGNFRYEVWLYWIDKVVPRIDSDGNQLFDKHGFPAPGPTGAAGETFAAFYMPIERLNDQNFHLTHGHIMQLALRQRICEGHPEYTEAWEHFVKNFPDMSDVLRTEQPKEIPTIIAENLSAEESFLRAMNGVRPLHATA